MGARRRAETGSVMVVGVRVGERMTAGVAGEERRIAVRVTGVA